MIYVGDEEVELDVSNDVNKSLIIFSLFGGL
jgi:hypothetical protein